MHQLLRDAADAFDWVVIDTPPVTLIPDAHLLASMTDAAVLVVEAGATEYALAREAVDIIGRDRVLGVVLNKVAERPRTGSLRRVQGTTVNSTRGNSVPPSFASGVHQ